MVSTWWQDDAACGMEEAWTAELDGHKQPPAAVLERLKAVCKECPVIKDCAAYAVKAHLESCVVAGLWLPASSAGRGKPDNQGYRHVVAMLQRKAAA